MALGKFKYLQLVPIFVLAIPVAAAAQTKSFLNELSQATWSCESNSHWILGTDSGGFVSQVGPRFFISPRSQPVLICGSDEANSLATLRVYPTVAIEKSASRYQVKLVPLAGGGLRFELKKGSESRCRITCR